MLSGLINLVGTIHHWLFKTLDVDDGQRYDEAINRLSKNQENIVDELNPQTSLSKNLINNYNRTISALSSNQQKLELELETLGTETLTQVNTLRDYIKIQNILAQLNLYCQILINFIDNLEDAMMFAKVNELDNAIISSSKLMEIIEYLNKK